MDGRDLPVARLQRPDAGVGGGESDLGVGTVAVGRRRLLIVGTINSGGVGRPLRPARADLGDLRLDGPSAPERQVQHVEPRGPLGLEPRATCRSVELSLNRTYLVVWAPTRGSIARRPSSRRSLVRESLGVNRRPVPPVPESPTEVARVLGVSLSRLTE
jgi:hypothetical protein